MKTKCYFIGGSMDGKVKYLEALNPCYRVALPTVKDISFYRTKMRATPVKVETLKIENYELRKLDIENTNTYYHKFYVYVLDTIKPIEQFEMLLTRYCNT